MGTAERKVREKENLRRAILDAARELFAANDYSSVSIRKIAHRIEYSPTAIYLHFRDKNEILCSLIDEGFTLLHASLSRITGDPVERLREGGRVYFKFALEQPHYYRLMFQLESPKLTEEAMPSCESAFQAFSFIVTAIQEGIASGAMRSDIDPIVLGHVIWASVHGAASLALSGHIGPMMPPECRDEFFDRTIDCAMRGILPIP
jgi:AcrR family transcriptional regulator